MRFIIKRTIHTYPSYTPMSHDEKTVFSECHFVKPKEVQETLGIQASTLRSWADQGKIRFIRTPYGQRLYDRHDLLSLLNVPLSSPSVQKQKYCYCRVSSSKQMDDLERQISFFRQEFPDHILVSDVASGINWKRKGLQTLLERSLSGNISEVVVAHRDRLCRFAFELLEFIFRLHDTRLIVLDQETNQSSDRELADDILSIVHVYSCRSMGKRRYKNKKGTYLSDDSTTKDIKTMDGDM